MPLRYRCTAGFHLSRLCEKHCRRHVAFFSYILSSLTMTFPWLQHFFTSICLKNAYLAFLDMPCSLCDLCSPTRDWTRAMAAKLHRVLITELFHYLTFKFQRGVIFPMKPFFVSTDFLCPHLSWVLLHFTFFLILPDYKPFKVKAHISFSVSFPTSLGFPGDSDSKESACNEGDLGSIPGSGRSPGEGNGQPLSILTLRNLSTEEPGRL